MKLYANYFLFFFLWHFMLSGQVLAQDYVTFSVRNKCPFPIWPATAPNIGQPVIAEGGFYLAPATTRAITAPWSWSGRIWARTGCNEFGSTPACETGDCDGRLACGGLSGEPPVTLVEVTLQADRSKLSYYDVSVVDGYNLPVMVTTARQTSARCTINGCRKNLNARCPAVLRVLNENGQVVACKSACLAFNRDSYCCRNEYGTPDTCKPSSYSRFFKDACPAYTSYAYDQSPSLASCSSREFVITFCPSGWGEGEGEGDGEGVAVTSV